MQLYKRKDGRSPFWFVDVVDAVTGKRVRKSTGQTDKRKAMTRALEIAAAASNTARELTIGQALDRYVARQKADGRKSWADAELKADKLVGKGGAERWGTRFSLDADMPLSKLDGEAILRLKVARAREGNSPGTIAAELRILRAACKAAVEGGYRGPALTKWGVPRGSAKLRYLTPEEAERVLRRLHPDTPIKAGSKGKLVVPKGLLRERRQDVHDLFLALVLTGGRWNEVAKMTPRQIDLDRGTITLFGWKTERERTVPLLPEVADMLRRRLSKPRGPYVFPGTTGKARSAPTRAIRRAMDAEGLNDPEVVEAFGRATNHTLRHTYASWLRQRGLGLDEIQPLLGHADIATTRIYAKVAPAEAFERAREALKGAMKG